MAILWIAAMVMAASANTVVVTENDFQMASQTYGALRRNASVERNPLRIAGKAYARGLGTHAVSEVPVTVPADAARLKGLVGIDDEQSGGQGKVAFRILSGNAVLWYSGPVKGGDSAVAFEVKIPAGCTRLYLQADDLGNNEYDHADWVDLTWVDGAREAMQPARTFAGKEFGLKPDVRDDQSVVLRQALQALQKAPGSRLVLEKGTYHFWHTGALRRHIHPSNHDQPTWQPVCIPLVDLRNVTIDGSGSLFLFHGEVQPVLIQDTRNLTLKNLALDHDIPPDSQGTVTRVDNASYDMTVDQKQFPHQIENGWITFTGENWKNADGTHGIVFSGKTGEIVAGTGEYGYRGRLTVIEDGRYRIEKNIKKDGVQPGDVITLRHGYDRPYPGCVLYRATDTVLENFAIHASHGMALLAQRSENITFNGGGVFPRKETGRHFSSGADATHFSNCRGKVVVENAIFEGMMDDAINVHATCLRIEERKEARTLRLRYVHDQAVGFEVVLPGETLRFIQARHLTPGESRTVASVQRINTRELLVMFDKPIPDSVLAGDAVENADWFPSVSFTKNIVRHNRARGSLFTTPGSVVVESNVFERIAGSAILLAGDANGWYESGACGDVLIRSNLFKNNLTSRFQFTEAILSIYPEIPELKGQKEYYHRNVRIEDNTFETFDVPLIFAISTDGLRFTGNTVTYNSDYPAWRKPPFILRRCKNVTIEENQVINAPFKWNINNAVDRQLTAKSEVVLKNARDQRPNIIVIVSDDQGYADATFQRVSKDAPTPHLDALAKDGVRCTRGYVTAPVCSPSRAGLMTGRYQQRFGHHNNLVTEAAEPCAHLPFSETLLPQVLAGAGYKTAMVGKWHLGLQDHARPYERGFSDFFGIITGGHDYYKNNPEQRARADGDYSARIERDGRGEKVEKYLTDAFGDEAVRVIRENRDQPFFLHLAFNAPHTPTQAPQEVVATVPESVKQKQRRTYLAQIIAMDNAIGRVREALKETGADKNTLIVFFSDNGGAKHPFYDNTPLRDHKGTLYEGGIRVPFLACYPGCIPAGSVCDLPVTSLDVFATACQLAGIKPENAAALDSRDMLPVLAGKSKTAAHDTLYWDFPNFGSAVLQGDLKLVVPRNGVPELYDLSRDIAEKHNLVALRPREVERLSSLLAQWKSKNVSPLWGADSERSKSVFETRGAITDLPSVPARPHNQPRN